jgi:hypothetical protein
MCFLEAHLEEHLSLALRRYATPRASLFYTLLGLFWAAMAGIPRDWLEASVAASVWCYTGVLGVVMVQALDRLVTEVRARDTDTPEPPPLPRAGSDALGE